MSPHGTELVAAWAESRPDSTPGAWPRPHRGHAFEQVDERQDADAVARRRRVVAPEQCRGGEIGRLPTRQQPSRSILSGM